VAAGTQPEALFDATLEPTLRQPLLYFLPPKTLHCKIYLYTIKFKNLPIKKYGIGSIGFLSLMIWAL